MRNRRWVNTNGSLCVGPVGEFPLALPLYNAHMELARTFTFLGTGTSVGVPMLGCDCSVCTSTNPKNHRYRSSALVTTPGGTILIDSTPEMRLQLIRAGVKVVHATLYTHYHVDHLFGLDDLRIFPMILNRPLPIYCSAATEEVIRKAFAYAFAPGTENIPVGWLPKLVFHRFEESPFEVLGEMVIPIPFQHGRFEVSGFRIGNMAYCTDVSGIPDRSWPLLEGLDVLILGALRPGKPHPSHFCLEQALDVIARLRPGQAYLTHMSHSMDHDSISSTLPANVALGYDGLSFSF